MTLPRTMHPSSFDALRREAQVLLSQLSTLPRAEWERKLNKLARRNQQNSPLPLAWLFRQGLKASTREEAPFWHSQVDACLRAARISHQIQAGWKQYGMTPWDVVHHQPHRPLPRYHSEPLLLGHR